MQLCWDATNPGCENYDPCLSKSPVSAEFVIEQQLGFVGEFSDVYIEDSLIAGGQFVRFRALEDSAYYKWYLGTEIVEGYEHQEVIRRMNVPFGLYDAHLVVQKGPDTTCFPMDDGLDSASKDFKHIPVCELMIHNKFKGIFDDTPGDSIVIEFMFSDRDFVPCAKTSFLYGFNLLAPRTFPDGKYDTTNTFVHAFSDSQVEWNGAGGATMHGSAQLNRKLKTIHIEYSYQNIERVFNGVVIP